MRGTGFSQSVVLVIQHDDGGTMGLVINRTSDVTTAELLPQLENREQGEEPVFRGGPVKTGTLRLLLLSDANFGDERVYEVLNGLYFTTSIDALEVALEHDDSTPVRVYAGYAGWAPGQLDGELRDGSWHVLPAEPEMVFDADPESIWHELIEESRKILVRSHLRSVRH